MRDSFILDNKVYSKLFLAMIKQQPDIAPYLFWKKRRARIKYNFDGTIGEQGSGKSYYEILEALAEDPTFNKSRIIYSTINFLDALDMLEDRSLKGRVILWDDAGVGLPSSEWYAISNKVVQLVMQTVRTLHPTIKFTMPEMKYLDPKQRHILTCIKDCRRTVENRTDVRIYTSKRIRIMDETYHAKFSFRIGMVKIKYGEVRIKHCDIAMLPPIFHQYEKIQQKFKFKTRKKLRDLLKGMKEKKLVTDAIDDYSTITLSDMEKRLLFETYTTIFGKASIYLNKSRRINIEKIQQEFRLNRSMAKIIKRFYDKRLLPQQVKEELEIE